MKHHRAEYRQLVTGLEEETRGRVAEKAVVVTNGLLSKPEQERLENHHGIRVMAVLHCEASSPIPEMRDYL